MTAVLLGDDLTDPRDQLLSRMVEVQAGEGGGAIALMEVERAQIHQYGCAAVESTADGDVVKVHDLVEKPEPGDAPSSYAVIGRYVLDPGVFDVLRTTEPAAAERSNSPTCCSSCPPTRRRTVRYTVSSSRGAAMTRVTAGTFCAPLSDLRANVKTWGRPSGPGSAGT